MTNRLAKESSPYLLQHADNPVDWYPWGEEALQKARSENKPIFLSIGYAACHWCHVMAHESFDDEETARILNEHLVSIKVDREERPDLDGIYMTAVQALTAHGGWPMSVFLTPDAEPFYAGTYYPPEPRHGLPSFRDVLQAIIEAWEGRRDEVYTSAREVTENLQRAYREVPSHPGRRGLTQQSLNSAQTRLASRYDRANGGWGAEPKFPQAMAIEFLLHRHVRTEQPTALAMAEDTLVAMARGGIYDQLGGGFHRYSVDARWLVPHFEKMLYDNALLARVYVHAWQLTGRPLFQAVAEETLDFVLREMTDAGGGFYSSLDADSEGEEGRFYTWTADDVREALGPDATAFIKAYGLAGERMLDGRSVLSFVADESERPDLRTLRERLWQARERRVRPARDEKVLTSWNGLMLAAFADAGRALERADYVATARRNAEFLLGAARTPEGRLRHVWKDGQATVNGYLDDYTHLIEGLLALYEATFEARWFDAARELAEQVLARFQGEQGFYDTSDDHEELLVRPRDLQDNAVPSGNAMAVTVLLKLADLAVEPRYADVARGALADVEPHATSHPLAFSQWLLAMDYALSPHVTLAIAGEPDASETRALLAVWEEGYHPHGMVAVGTAERVPILRGRRQLEGRPTAYLCGNASCQTPTTEPSVLRELLAIGRGESLTAQ